MRAFARIRESSPRRPRTLSFTRDLLLAVTIIVYVIGFAYQTAEVQQVGLGGSDQRVAGVFTLAVVALRHGIATYAVIAAGALALAAAAGAVAKRRAKARPCAPLIATLLIASIVMAVAGSAWLAWIQGSTAA